MKEIMQFLANSPEYIASGAMLLSALSFICFFLGFIFTFIPGKEPERFLFWLGNKLKSKKIQQLSNLVNKYSKGKSGLK